MSAIDKKPFIITVLETLTAAEAVILKDLINGEGTPIFRSLVPESAAKLTVSDKGIKALTLEVARAGAVAQPLYEGYLIYNDDYCVFISYSGKTNQTLTLIDINPNNTPFTYKVKGCELSITELRSELDDIAESEVEGSIPVPTSADVGKYLGVGDDGVYTLKYVKEYHKISKEIASVDGSASFSATSEEWATAMNNDNTLLEIRDTTTNDYYTLWLTTFDAATVRFIGLTKDGKKVEADIIKTGNIYSGTFAINDISGGGAEIEEILWADLKNKRDNSQLVPGQLYRITDYNCTTSTYQTVSVNNVFDIIVLAIDVNKLSEEAKAIQHAGDTYFANNKLEAWRLWYCLDNDTNRFDWADSTNGKGVIYRMIDEFNNDCPYDFKNIKFMYDNTGGNFRYCYTFDANGDDATISNLYLNTNENFIKPYFNNGKQILNKIYFISSSDTLGAKRNIFEANCHSCSFKTNCVDNLFMGENAGINADERLQSSIFYPQVTGIFIGSNSYQLEIKSSYIVFGTRTYDGQGHYTYYPIDYVRNVTIDHNADYLNIYSTDTDAYSSNYLQNVHICKTVQGSSAINGLDIVVPDRNLNYETTYKSTNSTEVIL